MTGRSPCKELMGNSTVKTWSEPNARSSSARTGDSILTKTFAGVGISNNAISSVQKDG